MGHFYLRLKGTILSAHYSGPATGYVRTLLSQSAGSRGEQRGSSGNRSTALFALLGGAILNPQAQVAARRFC